MVFRVGILGCGGIANAHASALQNITNAKLTAFCDIDVERAKSFNQRYADGSAKVYSNFHKMYEDDVIDAVYICLPPFAHTDDVESAAKNGVNVFIEKPIALDLKKAESMVSAVKKHKVKSQVGFCLRFGAGTMKLKEMADKGELGRPCLMIARYFCNHLHGPWWRDVKKSGGQVVEQIIHTYDLVRHFCGEPESVYAKIDNLCHKKVPGYTTEDVSASLITAKNGALIMVGGTNCAIPGMWIADFRLVAEKATVYFDSANDITITHTDSADQSTTKINCQNRNMYQAEDAELLDAMVEKRAASVPMIEGYKTLKLVLAVKESSVKGKAVKL